ncbi:MAG: hypothetical protein IJL97_01555, partial [Lachnospiraceae bacterium]|nr:hypothetical protein [Lachnospiraceae bacterium]
SPDNYLSGIAVNRITDEQLLIRIMKEAASKAARRAAAKMVNDQDALIEAAKNYEDEAVSSVAIARIKDRYTRLSIAVASPNDSVRGDAAGRLSGYDPKEESILVRLAAKDPQPRVRVLAVRRVIDQEFVYSIYKTDKDVSVREAAVKALTDQEKLEEIINTSPDESVIQIAIEGLADMKKRFRYQIKHLTDRDALIRAARDLPVDDPLLTEIALRKGGKYDYSWYKVGEAAVKRINDRDALMRIAKESDNINVQNKVVSKLSKEDLIELTGTAAGKAAYSELYDKKLLDAGTLDIIIGKHVAPASGLAKDEKEERDIKKTLEKLDPKLLEAFKRKDADGFMKKPCKETVQAAVFLLKKYGQDDYYGYGPSPAAYSVARFLREVYNKHPELREDLKAANDHSVHSHIDSGSSGCHTDEGPLIFNY